MSGEIVVRIDPDGTVVALSGSGVEEALDLRALGPMETERAGYIVFDKFSQTWGWCPAEATGDGLGGRGFRTRAEAVADEIATMMGTL